MIQAALSSRTLRDLTSILVGEKHTWALGSLDWRRKK